ncbi:MAG TPA: HNH endonuclease [Caldilineaceae bacterium]|nr:HNH endonuclease [Caldilineaceae bacterium]
MRPVTIVANPAPAYNEVAETNANVDTDAHGVQTPVTYGQVNQRLQALIDVWVTNGMQTQYVNHATRRVWAPGQQQADYDLYKDQLSSNYGNARGALVTAVGQYCSYCEIPVNSNLHVEHVLPKNSFPAQSLSWTNFLLACPSCNTTKGDNPAQWINGAAMATPNAVAYLNDPANYLWPNRFWQALANNSLLPYRLVLRWMDVVPATARGYAAGDWVFGAVVTPVERNALVASYRNGEMIVRNGRWAVPGPLIKSWRHFGVEVQPNPAATAAQQLAVTMIIEMTKLNRIVANAENDSVDRRIELRTEACFKALLFRDYLQTAYAADPVNLYPAVLAQATACMVATGFWCAWVTVLSSLNNLQPVITQAIQGTAQATPGGGPGVRTWVV